MYSFIKFGETEELRADRCPSAINQQLVSNSTWSSAVGPQATQRRVPIISLFRGCASAPDAAPDTRTVSWPFKQSKRNFNEPNKTPHYQLNKGLTRQFVVISSRMIWLTTKSQLNRMVDSPRIMTTFKRPQKLHLIDNSRLYISARRCLWHNQRIEIVVRVTRPGSTEGGRMADKCRAQIALLTSMCRRCKPLDSVHIRAGSRRCVMRGQPIHGKSPRS